MPENKESKTKTPPISADVKKPTEPAKAPSKTAPTTATAKAEVPVKVAPTTSAKDTTAPPKTPATTRPIPTTDAKNPTELPKAFATTQANTHPVDQKKPVEVLMLEDALQAEIDALTDRRKELYRQKRRGQEIDSDIQTITRALRPLRSQLRTCGQVQRAIPQIRAQERRCRDAMRKEKDHRTETIDKADKARPRKFSLPDR